MGARGAPPRLLPQPSSEQSQNNGGWQGKASGIRAPFPERSRSEEGLVTSNAAPSQPVDRNDDSFTVVFRVRPRAGPCLALRDPPTSANRRKESGGRRAPWLREPELPAGGDNPLDEREQRFHVATLIKDVGGENDWKPILRGGEQCRVWVAPVHAERLGLHARLVEGIERAECKRLGRVIGNE